VIIEAVKNAERKFPKRIHFKILCEPLPEAEEAFHIHTPEYKDRYINAKLFLSMNAKKFDF
jgi:hypothetical protein